jgi:hypothetical protein
MMNTRYVDYGYEVGPAMIRALSSLTRDHARQIAEAVQADAPAWEVDCLDDYNGYLAVLVSFKHDMDARPTYLISGTLHGIELAEVQDDISVDIGQFDRIDDVIEALISRLSRGAL